MKNQTWTPAANKPRREGLYQVQTLDTQCGCCWEEAHYRDGAWWVFGEHATLKVRKEVQVTHWRKPKEDGFGAQNAEQ